MSDVLTPGQSAGTSWLATLKAWRQAWLTIEKSEAGLRFARSFTGQAIMHGVLIGVLVMIPFVRTSHVALISVALAGCWLLPHYRLAVLTVSGLAYFLLRPFKMGPHYDHMLEPLAQLNQWVPTALLTVAPGVLFLIFAYAMIANGRHKFVPVIANYPLAFMAAVGAALAIATVALPKDHMAFGAAWVALAYLTSTYFFLGYVLLDMKAKQTVSLPVQMGFMRPFWAGFAPPVKGPNFIMKHQATTDDALAVSRLKALKLAVWALLLYGVWEIGINAGLHDVAGLPYQPDLIAASAAGAPLASLGVRWLSLATYFLAMVIYMGFMVHTTVAVIRMAGFCIPRGMARPLSSRTIAEFWGRYLFYFKEMLVDFFFYPAFRRWFKKSPKLRMAFATFAAAFIGNIFFDFFHQLPSLAFEDQARIAQGFVNYCVYAGILTIGIIWSQMMQKPAKPEHGFLRYEVIPRAQVCLFFALLLIIDDAAAVVPIGDRLTYLFGLFGV